MDGQTRKTNQLTSSSGAGKRKQVRKKATVLIKTEGGGEHKGKGIVRWLGGPSLIEQDIYTDFDVIKVGTSGISKASVDALTRFIGVSKKSMAEEILNISVKTLERKQPTDIMDVKTSSHVLEVAKVMQHAFEVFEQEEKARQWLNRENRALNGIRPVQGSNTLTGINMVNDILTRIEEGVYS